MSEQARLKHLDLDQVELFDLEPGAVLEASGPIVGGPAKFVKAVYRFAHQAAGLTDKIEDHEFHNTMLGPDYVPPAKETSQLEAAKTKRDRLIAAGARLWSDFPLPNEQARQSVLSTLDRMAKEGGSVALPSYEIERAFETIQKTAALSQPARTDDQRVR